MQASDIHLKLVEMEEELRTLRSAHQEELRLAVAGVKAQWRISLAELEQEKTRSAGLEQELTQLKRELDTMDRLRVQMAKSNALIDELNTEVNHLKRSLASCKAAMAGSDAIPKAMVRQALGYYLLLPERDARKRGVLDVLTRMVDMDDEDRALIGLDGKPPTIELLKAMSHQWVEYLIKEAEREAQEQMHGKEGKEVVEEIEGLVEKKMKELVAPMEHDGLDIPAEPDGPKDEEGRDERLLDVYIEEETCDVLPCFETVSPTADGTGPIGAAEAEPAIDQAPDSEGDANPGEAQPAPGPCPDPRDPFGLADLPLLTQTSSTPGLVHPALSVA